MSLFILIVISTVVLCLGFVLAVGARAMKLAKALDVAERKNELVQSECRALAAKVAAAQDEDRKKIGWLDHQEQELTWLRSELDRRPKITRKTYKILTLGVKATGKTSLTLKWANPLIDLGLLEGTKIDRYERTVSLLPQKDAVIEHVFEVHDWGGEHIVDALHELVMDEINGLLIVVDLGGKDATEMEVARVEEQLQEFQPQALKYFFGPKTLASCKTVVLFINKSDLLSGTAARVEEQAKKLYAPLIYNLMKYSTQIDIRVFVGSASYGHSTHLLFSRFVEKILPKNAYDSQLLQRMQTDFAATRVPCLVAAPATDEKTTPLQGRAPRMAGTPKTPQPAGAHTPPAFAAVTHVSAAGAHTLARRG